MRPLVEHISPNVGSSFKIDRYNQQFTCNTNYWHHHPEYELVYVKKGMGEHRVGNHLSNYDDGTLIFIGPNVPHLPFFNYQYSDNYEIVVQMNGDFMGEGFLERPELLPVKRLFHRADRGVIFGNGIKEAAGPKLNEIMDSSPFKRLMLLLELFHELAATKDYRMVSNGDAPLAMAPADFNRINGVYTMIAERYMDDLTLEEAAQKANMTVPAFCRLFKKLTTRTFTQFLNEYRISESVQMLHNEEQPISAVAFACGYNSLSYFNRQFRKITGHKPTDYRQVLNSMI